MKSDRLIVVCGPLLILSWCASALAQHSPETSPARTDLHYAKEPGPLLRADLRLDHALLQSGQPVWAEFSITNLSDTPMNLQVPDAESVEQPRADMGLPFAHVFSARGFAGISLRDGRGDLMDDQVTRKPAGPVPVIHLAPHASVGARVELTKYYEALLRRAGKYTLIWRPYGGTLESEPVTITLMAEQQATLLTDYGKMVMRFYYDQAPRHVQNFIDLVNQRFYDNLTFHRVVPGNLIQGGSPSGDGHGTRPDGKRIAAEFSKIPFEAGTVGMARSPRDPDSASCQFFICLSRQAAFDGNQTAFGYLVGQESFETLAKIAAVPTGPKDRPLKAVQIRAISLEEVPLRERESPPVAISNSTRPAMADREAPPPSYGHEPSPAPATVRTPAASPRDLPANPNGPDISPALHLARALRLATSTQPSSAR